MINQQSVCIYHNGNSRILQYYRDKFSHLTFSGNWAESIDRPATDHLWEICFADATRDVMTAIVDCGIFVVRHISTYQDDMDNLLPECQRFAYVYWLDYVVSKNLCFADQVVNEVVLDHSTTNEVAVITTGRTANMHLQQLLDKHGDQPFEYSKIINHQLMESKSAVFLWRVNQWDCLSSTWIAKQTKYEKAHQLFDQPAVTFENTVPPLPQEWVESDWVNVCYAVLDHAMLYRYVCQRPISWTTTEYIVSNFQTKHQKLKYNKSELFNNYQQAKEQYEQSSIAKHLNLLYNKVISHIDPWSLKGNLT